MTEINVNMQTFVGSNLMSSIVKPRSCSKLSILTQSQLVGQVESELGTAKMKMKIEMEIYWSY